MTADRQQSRALEALSTEILAVDPADVNAIDHLATVLYKRGAIQGPIPHNTADILTLAGDLLGAIRDKAVGEPDLAIRSVSEAISAVAAISHREDEKNLTRMRSALASLKASLSTCNIISEKRSADSADISPIETTAELFCEHAEICLERLDAAEESLLAMETGEDIRHIHRVLREFHTIKGSSALLGLGNMKDLAHNAEEILSRIEKGLRPLYSEDVDIILKVCDFLRISSRSLLSGVEPDDLPSEGFNELMQELLEVIACKKGTFSPLRACDRQEVFRSEQKKPRDQVKSESTTRVPIERLDNLVNMVDELLHAQSVAARNDSVQIPEPFYRRGRRLSRRGYRQDHWSHNAKYKDVDRELACDIERIGKVAKRLRDLSLSLRMGTLETPFKRAARLVRDLSRKSNKLIRFTTAGETTEIDRSMVEYITDPLVHLLRNAVDHGIESPEIRRESGKNPIATISLTARQVSSHVIIELSDDGRGLDRDRIWEVALDKSLIDGNVDLSDSEVFSLIFLPGFSTAKIVTDISGRGVGLDAVWTNIEKLQGKIDVSSTPREGTVFRISLPVTTAMMEAVTVHTCGETYLIPSRAIEKSIKFSTGSLDDEFITVDDEQLRLVDLGQLLSLSTVDAKPSKKQIIILSQGRNRCAVIVDDCLPGRQIIVTPLESSLIATDLISGSSIARDGKVVLILDPASIITASGELIKR